MGDVRHEFINGLPDGDDPAQTQPSHWNADHDIDGGFEKVSSNDTTYGYLHGKLVAGDGITLTENNDGGDETLTIEATGGGGGDTGWETDSTDGTKLKTGRTLIWGQGGSTATSPFEAYISFSGGAAEIASQEYELTLGAYGGYPIVMSSDQGVVLPSYNNGFGSGDIVQYDDGHAYVETREGTLHFLEMAQPELSFSTEEWLHQGLPSSGWTPRAMPIGFVQNGTYTTARTLAANHDTIAVPFYVPTPMDLATIEFWNTDTASLREWEVAVWHQMYQGNSTADKLLQKVPGSQNFNSTTPGSAGLRGTPYGTGDCYVPAGLVWVTLKNISASNTLGVGYLAGSTQMPVNLAQQKTLASNSFDGDTLDFVAVTWTKLTDIHAVSLRGRVFGQSGAF